MKKLTLVVCDVQPDVTKKLPNSQQFIDLVDLAVRAGRNSRRTTLEFNIVHTMIRFPESSYDCIPLLHPKLGILRKLQRNNNSPIHWFTSSELCIPAAADPPKEVVVSRTTYLPHANDTKLLEALQYEESLDDRDFVVIGYAPTVQAVCHILGDVIGTPNVQILKECVRDESMERCQAFLDYGLMFKEEVTSLVDFIECKFFVV